MFLLTRKFSSITNPSKNDAGQFGGLDAYNQEDSIWKPYHFKTKLIPYSTFEGDMTVELTSTRCV